MYGKGLLVYVLKCIVIFYIFKGIIGVKKKIENEFLKNILIINLFL